MQVLPAFREFEESKGIITRKDGFHEYPDVYMCIDQEPIECIFLEDLTVNNFKMLNYRTEPITLDHVNLVMCGLAKFHAISFGMKNQQLEKFQKLTAPLSDILIRKDDKNMQDFLNFWPAAVIGAITDPNDAHIKQKIEQLYERKQMDIAADVVDGKSSEPFSVICHGDVWTNNTMFKYDKNGKPIDIRFLDYQIARYSSPACDITYYLYCCTTKDLRDQHYDTFLKTYHNTLSEHLKR